MEKDSAIGNILVRSGLIDAGGLARARETQGKDGISLARALVSLGLADEEGVTAAIAKGLKLEILGAEPGEVLAEVAALLPADFCRARRVVPLSVQEKVLRLVIEDPLDYSTTQDVEFRTGKRVVAVLASSGSIQELLKRVYPAEEQVPSELSEIDTAGEVESVGDTDLEVVDPTKLAQDIQMPPVVRLVILC